MKLFHQSYGNRNLLVLYMLEIAIKIYYILIVIATELVDASNTNDISFKMQNSILIPAEFIQQRSSITGRCIGVTN